MTTEKKYVNAVGFLAALAISTSAVAGEAVGPRRVLEAGCHNVGGTCYVTLEGASFGGTLGCSAGPQPQFRFDNGDTAIGKSSYASFLSAFLSGKRVVVFLDGCSSQGYPKLVYFSVVN